MRLRVDNAIYPPPEGCALNDSDPPKSRDSAPAPEKESIEHRPRTWAAYTALRESQGAIPSDFLADREQVSEDRDPFAGLAVDELSTDDPVGGLTSEDAIAIFLSEAEATNDAAFVEHARAIADRARAMIKERADGQEGG